MGRTKALLPWPSDRRMTLLEYQFRQLQASHADEILVVLGHRATELAPLITGPRTRAIHNPHYQTGKTSSIRAGVAALGPAADAVLILGVDQPRPTWLLNRLITAHQQELASITTPSFRGRRSGHPPIIARELFPELLAT